MDRSASRLLAEKVVRELFRIAQAYGKEHPFAFEDMVHDLALALQRRALRRVTLKFFRPDHQREVLLEYSYAFHAGRPRFYLDDAHGLAIVPLSPPIAMTLVAQFDPPAAALPGLRLNWGTAPDYVRQTGFEHHDGNTAARTGGRASKRVFMADSLRSQGRVKLYRSGGQYGFITGRDGVDVFFHASNVNGFHPRTGQRVTYLPLATPRGIQAKDVRLA